MGKSQILLSSLLVYTALTAIVLSPTVAQITKSQRQIAGFSLKTQKSKAVKPLNLYQGWAAAD